MSTRHDELASEMLFRGMNHKSPYEPPALSRYNLDGFTVDKEVSISDLTKRCPECAARIKELTNHSE